MKRDPLPKWIVKWDIKKFELNKSDVFSFSRFCRLSTLLQFEMEVHMYMFSQFHENCWTDPYEFDDPDYNYILSTESFVRYCNLKYHTNRSSQPSFSCRTKYNSRCFTCSPFSYIFPCTASECIWCNACSCRPRGCSLFADALFLVEQI